MTVRLPFIINGKTELIIESGTRAQLLKRTNQLRIYADRRHGKDSWSIYNEVKQQVGDEFDRHVICSPYGDYATLAFRW